MGQRTYSEINRAFQIAVQYGHDFINELADAAGISKREAARIGAGKSNLPDTVHAGTIKENLRDFANYVSPPTQRALIAALD